MTDVRRCKIILSWIFLLARWLACWLTLSCANQIAAYHTDSWPASVGHDRYVEEDTQDRSFSWPKYIMKGKIWSSLNLSRLGVDVMKKPCSQPKQYFSWEAIRDYFSYPCSASCLSIQLLSGSSCHVEPSIIQTK